MHAERFCLGQLWAFSLQISLNFPLPSGKTEVLICRGQGIVPE